MGKKAHLLKVAVQTFWVVVDDETGDATEQADTGVVVPAADWPTFYDRHCADFSAIQEAVVAEGEAKQNGAAPNRAARRAKPKRATPRPSGP